MSFLKTSGLTKGVVVDTDDPAGFHRIQVRIPQLDGSFTDSPFARQTTNKRARKDNDNLIWCEVNYPFGSNIPPEPNQVVLVGFFNGDTSTPVVLGWLGYEYTNLEEQFEIKDKFTR